MPKAVKRASKAKPRAKAESTVSLKPVQRSAKQEFLVSDAISFGFDTTLHRFGLIFGVSLLLGVIFGLIPVVLDAIWKNADGAVAVLALVVRIALWIFEIFVSLGAVLLMIKIARGAGEFRDLLACFDVVLAVRYVVAAILYGLIVLGGLILFIIPGIIWAIQFRFYALLIVDKKLGPIEALKASSRMTRGVKWQLLGLVIVLFLIQILGFLALIVGLFVTVPLAELAVIYVYEKLLPKADL